MEKLRSVSPVQTASSNFSWNGFGSQQGLAETLALKIIYLLDAAIAQRGLAVIAFSGGSTPLALFKALAHQQWDWRKVVITLVDERWVDLSDPLSNARFLQTHLLDKLSGRPRFVTLYREGFNAGCSSDAKQDIILDYCDATKSTPNALMKFDVAILGMGDDGHTASYFPDADNIANLLDSKNKYPLLCCHSASSSVERITWSLPILLSAAYLALHIVGANKRNVFDQALQADDALVMPIRSMLFQQSGQLQVFYAD